MLPYIDIHSHRCTEHDEIICLPNIIIDQLEALPQDLFSAGIHPWYLDKVEEQKTKLLQLVKRQECLAIGECGLDKLHGQWSLQEETFLWQLEQSEKFRKPLIIHCVKAFDVLLKLKKERKPKMPWLIHGFRSNTQQASRLLNTNCYLSFGSAVLNPRNTKLIEALKSTPLDKLFLETDDSEIDISSVYQFVSQIVSVPMDDLKEQLIQNYRNLFFR